MSLPPIPFLFFEMNSHRAWLQLGTTLLLLLTKVPWSVTSAFSSTTADLEPIWIGFGSDLDRIWIGFGADLERIWIGFGAALDPL